MSDRIYVTPEELTSTSTDKWDQETSISWTRDQNIISIDSSDNTFITKMKHLMERDPKHYKCYYYASNIDKKTGKPSNYVFEIDKRLLSFRVDNAKKKQLTEEEKVALAARLKKNNSNCKTVRKK